MRALAILIGSTALASALPSRPGPNGTDACCCCDISGPAMSCKMKSQDEGCICPFVQCPADAKTVWPEHDNPGPTTPPAMAREVAEEQASEEGQTECCCCDISKPAISCQMRSEAEGYFCAQVACPADAPTVWPNNDVPTPTSPPAVVREPEEEKEEDEEQVDCCCCDLGQKATVCRMQGESKGCYCPKVFCPEGFPTIRAHDGMPKPTST